MANLKERFARLNAEEVVGLDNMTNGSKHPAKRDLEKLLLPSAVVELIEENKQLKFDNLFYKHMFDITAEQNQISAETVKLLCKAIVESTKEEYHEMGNLIECTDDD